MPNRRSCGLDSPGPRRRALWCPVVLGAACILGAAGPIASADAPPSGRELFAREWRPNDPLCHGGDGLGPVYNATSCLACHGQAAPGGGGPADKNVEMLSMIPGTITRVGRTNLMSLASELKIEDLLPPQAAGMMIIPPPVDSLVELDRNAAGGVETLVLSAGGSELRGDRFRIRTDPFGSGLGLVAIGERGEIRGESFTVRPDDGALSGFHPGLRHASSVVLHRSGVDPRYERWRLALIWRVPDPGVTALVGARLARTRRNPPALFGAGLIDALPEAAFSMTAASEPAAVRGRVSRGEDGRVGRFGWKAQVASLGEFVRSACANELGLEAPGHHQPASPFEPDAVATSLDLTERECDALTDYVGSLPAPIRLVPSEPSEAHAVEDGRRLFASIGCAACHTPNLGRVRGIYSDLLLHDVGMSDVSVYYGKVSVTPRATSPGDATAGARATEWRTPPLWGVRDSAPYLHDGRARTLTEAVAEHGTQGAASARAFAALPEVRREHLLAFLASLSAPVGPDEVSRRQTAPDLGSGPEPPRAFASVPIRAAAQILTRRHPTPRRPTIDPDEARAEEQRRREAARPAHLAATLRSARALEKMGKPAAALDFYRALAREAPDSAEARAAVERIGALAR